MSKGRKAVRDERNGTRITKKVTVTLQLGSAVEPGIHIDCGGLTVQEALGILRKAVSRLEIDAYELNLKRDNHGNLCRSELPEQATSRS